MLKSRPYKQQFSTCLLVSNQTQQNTLSSTSQAQIPASQQMTPPPQNVHVIQDFHPGYQNQLRFPQGYSPYP